MLNVFVGEKIIGEFVRFVFFRCFLKGILRMDYWKILDSFYIFKLLVNIVCLFVLCCFYIYFNDLMFVFLFFFVFIYLIIKDLKIILYF